MGDSSCAPESQTIRVTGLCGSLRPGSFTRMALEVALRGASDAGVVTRLIDLREYELAFVTAVDGEEQRLPDVQRLRGELRAADGIILGTPEYHGSFSGVLKNALDLMGFDEFEGKMVGLVGVSGGRMGAYDAINSLRNIGRVLHAWVIPQQVSIPEAWKAFDETGRMKDTRLEERVRQVGSEVAKFARLHKCAAAHEFLEMWQRAPENPGGGER